VIRYIKLGEKEYNKLSLTHTAVKHWHHGR